MKPSQTEVVIDRVEELRQCTSSKINKIQQSRVPTFGDIVLYGKFKYKYDGEQQWVRDMSYQCYLAFNIPYVNIMDENKNFIFIENMVTCITRKWVYPFILFIQGKFIPWTNIIIVKDYYYTYLLISGFDNFNIYDQYESILLPCYIKYGENSLLYQASDNPPFLFNSSGLLTLDPTKLKGRVEVIDKHVIGHDYNITDDKLYFAVQVNDNPIDKNSIIVFNDGVPYREALDRLTHEGANVFKYTKKDENEDVSKLLFRVYYYTLTTENPSNVFNNPINIDSVRDDIISGNHHNYIDYVKNIFNFSHSRNMTYDENVTNSINYILKYNPSLFNKSYLRLATIESASYSGEEVSNMINEKNQITFHRRSHDKERDSFPMIFHNGYLFHDYHTIEYNANLFTLTISTTIKPDDKFEFLFYEYANNESVDIIVNQGEYNYTSKDFQLKDCELYSTEVEDPQYDLYSDKDHIQYSVPFSYIKEDGYKYMITLDNPWYYGKTLRLTSKKQFRYCWNRIRHEQLTITLSTDFKYCHDLSRYLVFVNGTKLDPDQILRQTKADPNFPFDELCLYTNVILHIGDIVDVFYLPDPFNDHLVTGENLTDTGYIRLNFGEQFYNFSKNLQFIFMNGLKVHPDLIQDLGGNTIRINNQIENVSSIHVLDYIDPIQILADIVITDEVWKSFIDSMTEEEFNAVIKDIPGISQEYNSRDEMVPDKAVVYEIVHNFYQVSGIVKDKYGELSYHYTTEVLDNMDYDTEGNFIIRATDANIDDKADIYDTEGEEELEEPSYNYDEEGE